MKLVELLNNIDYKIINGNTSVFVNDITYDSRTANKDNLFIALVGIDRDGHDYISDVRKNGCNIFIVSKNIKPLDNETIIKVNDTRKILPILSANLFKNPGNELIKIGITGTKGKTSISYMIKSLLENNGDTVGVIGTNGTFFKNVKIEHKNTTPESYLVQKYMRMMVDNGIKYLIMEVSSQALKVGRVSNIIFDYSIFTNLSMDHIGKREHPSYQDYVYSKSLLFRQSKMGIINKDDKEFNNITKNSTSKIITYGTENSDYKIENIEKYKDNNSLGMNFTINNEKYFVNMPGTFSVYNAASVVVLGKILNIDRKIILDTLKNISVEGRVEVYNIKDFKVVIDYAHNNLSIESIITTMRPYADRIITIVGCGGGRDKSIRVGIGETSGKLSDLTIITEDNRRNDNLDEINKDIEYGVKKSKGDSIIINNREEAIEYAIKNAKKGDIILLLGKGHEKFPEIKGHIYEFDEKKIIERIVRENEIR